jgi:hypothetical protein
MKKHGIVSYNDIRGYELLTYKLEVAPTPTAGAKAAPLTTQATAGQVQGSINIKLFQKLNPNLNPSTLSTVIGKVRNGSSSFTTNDNKMLSDLMISMIKTSDDTLLNQIFTNLKQIQAK